MNGAIIRMIARSVCIPPNVTVSKNYKYADIEKGDEGEGRGRGGEREGENGVKNKRISVRAFLLLHAIILHFHL
jgi:hypothetical protein